VKALSSTKCQLRTNCRSPEQVTAEHSAAATGTLFNGKTGSHVHAHNTSPDSDHNEYILRTDTTVPRKQLGGNLD